MVVGARTDFGRVFDVVVVVAGMEMVVVLGDVAFVGVQLVEVIDKVVHMGSVKRMGFDLVRVKCMIEAAAVVLVREASFPEFGVVPELVHQ